MNDSEKLSRIGQILTDLAMMDKECPDISPMGAQRLLRMIQEDIEDLDFGARLNWGGCSPGWPQDYEPELEITIKDESVSAKELAQWVREGNPEAYTTTDALYIARCILKGETWRPPYNEYKIERRNPWCLIRIFNEHGTESERFM